MVLLPNHSISSQRNRILDDRRKVCEKQRVASLKRRNTNKASKAKHRSNNYDQIREKERIYAIASRKNNPEKVRALDRARYARDKDKRLAASKAWAKANPEKVNASNRAKFKRYRETDPLFALSSRIRSRMHNALKREGFTKQAPIASILGCDWATLKSHIESQFTAKMSWDNRHLWEIDHIIPLGSAETEEEIIKLSHFSNLTPMWKLVNNAKGDLMPDEWAKISHLYTDYIPEELA